MELWLVEANLQLTPEEKQVVFWYPYIKYVSKLQDNYRQAIAIMIQVENRLDKSGRHIKYDNEVCGYLG